MEHTAQDVAAWMIDEIKKDGGYVDHYWVSSEITVRFGKDWDYYNDNGNPAIDPRILKEFRKQHGGTIEWDKSAKNWSLI